MDLFKQTNRGDLMGEIFHKINFGIEVAFGVWTTIMVYCTVLMIIGLLPCRKFKKTDKLNTFAVLVSARNEEQTIGQLVDSVKKQDYPADKITCFVIAHNCTDKTAEIARNAGAIVYEFNDPRAKEHPRKYARKGHAYKYFFEKIKADYPNGIETFDATVMFDADNVLARDCIARLNDGMVECPQFDMFVAYQMSKNFDNNANTSYSSMYQYSDMIRNKRPLTLLGVSCFGAGCGACFRSNVLRDNWDCLTLTEDTEFCLKLISRGYRSICVESARFWDERALSLDITVRQRMRWANGQFYMYFRRLPRLIFGVFFPYDRRLKRNDAPKIGILKRTYGEIMKRASCLHSIFLFMPWWVYSFIITNLYPIYVLVFKQDTYTMFNHVIIFVSMTWSIDTMEHILVLIRERKWIQGKMHFEDFMFHVMSWPLFAIYMQYVNFVAVIYPVKWKPIPHVIPKTVDICEKEKSILPIEDIFKRQKTPPAK